MEESRILKRMRDRKRKSKAGANEEVADLYRRGYEQKIIEFLCSSKDVVQFSLIRDNLPNAERVAK